MFVRITSSGIGRREVINPVRPRSPNDQQGQQRGAGHNRPDEDADASEQAPSAPTNHRVDKSA